MSQYQNQNRQYNFVKRKSDAPHSYNIQAKLQNGVLSIFVHDTMTNKQWRQEFTQVSFPSHKLYHVAKALIAAIQEMVKVTQQKNYANLHYANGVKPIAILVYNKWCYLTIHGSKLPSFALRPVDHSSSRSNKNNNKTNTTNHQKSKSQHTNNSSRDKNKNNNSHSSTKVNTRSCSPRAFSPRSVAPQSIPLNRSKSSKNNNSQSPRNNKSNSRSHSTTSTHSPRAFSPRSVAPREPGLKASKTEDAHQVVIKIETTRKVQHFPPLPHPPARSRSNSNSTQNKLIVLSDCRSHSATSSVSSSKACGIAPTRPLPALPPKSNSCDDNNNDRRRKTSNNNSHQYSRSMGNLAKKDTQNNINSRVVTPAAFKDLKSLKRHPPMNKMVHGDSLKSASLSLANSESNTKNSTIQSTSMYSQQSLNSITECSAMDRQSSSSSASSFDSEIITTDTSNYGSFESLMGSDSDSHLGSLDSLMTYSGSSSGNGSNNGSNNRSSFMAFNNVNTRKRQNNVYNGMDADDDSDDYDPSMFEREYFNLERGNVQCRERSNQLDPMRHCSRDLLNSYGAGVRRMGTVYGKNDNNNNSNMLCVNNDRNERNERSDSGKNGSKSPRKSKNKNGKKKKRKNSKGKRYEKWNNFTLAVNGDIVTDITVFMEAQAAAEEAYYDEEEEIPYYDPNYLGLAPEYED